MACSQSAPSPSPTLDIEATIVAQVRLIEATTPPSPTLDIEATIVAQVGLIEATSPPSPTQLPIATSTQVPTATPTPTAPPVPAQSRLAIGGQQGVVGSTVDMEVSLSDVESSIAGFLVTLRVEDGTLAQFVAVEFPDYSDPVTGTQLTRLLDSLPASSITIAAVDLSESTLQGPFDYVVIATISVELLGSGLTQVIVVPPPRIDDYAGQPVSVKLISGVLNIDP